MRYSITRSRSVHRTAGPMLGVLLALAMMGAPTGALANGNAGSTFVYTESFDFTMPAGQCPSLPSDLSVDFSATVHGHIHVSTDAQACPGREAWSGTWLNVPSEVTERPSAIWPPPAAIVAFDAAWVHAGAGTILRIPLSELSG